MQMPSFTFWQLVVSLGVPGLALGVFYMLFRTFNWDFPKVPQKWVAPIIILFILATATVILTALVLWAPKRTIEPDKTSSNEPEKTASIGSDKAEASLDEFIETLTVKAEVILKEWKHEKEKLEEKNDESLLPRIQALEVAEFQFKRLHEEHVAALRDRKFMVAHERLVDILRFLTLVDKQIDFAATMHYAQPQIFWCDALKQGNNLTRFLKDYPGDLPIELLPKNGETPKELSEIAPPTIDEIDVIMRPAFHLLNSQLERRKQSSAPFIPKTRYK
ncbi:hypothetical protein [Gimesia aquarii]|uniref:Uncharacterized protein n=1 Tax=Gimesia aquarii TaxID=2527964 RepID=A0A517VP95_9PLAN|nr:hypothetical protein [Gimesia aquarii]QDT94837.1 hypothetical protein V144x_02690 [Gimesia aquarii]